MYPLLAAIALLSAASQEVTDEAPFDPNSVSLVDAVNCHIDAPTYNSFAMAVMGEDDLAARRHWRKIKTDNPFLTEYELPEAVLVTGNWSTRRIAFSSSGIVAILDVEDPAVVARAEGIAIAADPDPMIEAIVAAGKATRAQIEEEMKFRKFLGERVIVDVTDPPSEDDDFRMQTIISRVVSNVATHPGKTLYGCSYRMILLDKAGKPI